jgi:hypothetical protein
MDQTAYDVFKGTRKKTPLWLGSMTGFQRAVDQMNRMAARLPGDYFVIDSVTNEVVATVQQRAGAPIRAAGSSPAQARAS